MHPGSAAPPGKAGLGSAFVIAGIATLLTAAFTGVWLARSKPAEVLVPQAQQTEIAKFGG